MNWIGMILGIGALGILALIIVRYMDGKRAESAQTNAAILAQAEAERAKAARDQERSRNSGKGIANNVLDTIRAVL
jgi:Tfp pilus assembly protein PilV